MKITYIFDDSYISQFLTVTNSILKNEKFELKDKIIFYINYFGQKESINQLLTLANTNFPNNTFKIKHIPSEFLIYLKNRNPIINSIDLPDISKLQPFIVDFI